MAAVWDPNFGLSGKQIKSAEKMDRELKRLRFDVKQYDAQLKKLQRELSLKSTELKKLKSCGACTCLGDRRRSQRNMQTAEVQDLGTFGNTISREIGDKARLEIHGQRPASMEENGNRVDGQGRRGTSVSALRRSRTEYLQNGAYDGGAHGSAVVVEKERELARLHEELAHLRQENSALKDQTGQGVPNRRQDDENVRTLKELGRQVRELENELMKLRDERYRLLAESEQLRDDVNSKETNLLRCETQLTKSEREKTELADQVRRLENRERQLTEELNGYKKRSSTTVRSNEMVNGHHGVDSSSRLAKWSSDLTLAREGLVNHHNAIEAARTRTLQHELSIKTTEWRNRSCKACAALREKLQAQSNMKMDELQDMGTYGNTATREIVEKARLEINGQRPASMEENGNRVDGQGRRGTSVSALGRSRTEYLQNGAYDGGAHGSAVVVEKERELARLHEELAHLRQENFALKDEAGQAVQNRRKDDENVRALKELSRQMRDLENELMKLREERVRLLAENEQLRTDVNSKETRLLRCANQLTKVEQEKSELTEQVRRSSSYERLVVDKDREISKLKGTIRDLERDYEGFRKNLSEQEAHLLRLQRDLSNANAMKEKTELGRVVLADDYKRLQQQYQKLYQDKAAMQRELELCVEEQDKQKRLLQRYLNEIQSYERLLADKEKERMEMLLQFQASAERVCKCGSPPRM